MSSLLNRNMHVVLFLPAVVLVINIDANQPSILFVITRLHYTYMRPSVPQLA